WSDPGVPLVAVVLPVAAFAATDTREAVDELDHVHILGVFVAELSFDAQPQRRAVLYREVAAIEPERENRLRMVGVVHVDALVVILASISVHRIGAMEDHIAHRRFGPDDL